MAKAMSVVVATRKCLYCTVGESKRQEGAKAPCRHGIESKKMRTVVVTSRNEFWHFNRLIIIMLSRLDDFSIFQHFIVYKNSNTSRDWYILSSFQTTCGSHRWEGRGTMEGHFVMSRRHFFTERHFWFINSHSITAAKQPRQTKPHLFWYSK
jgi:hypothetical protein